MASPIPTGYLNRHSIRSTSHFLWMSHSRHSTRIPQLPFHPADIPFSLDVSQPPFHLDISAQSYPADIPFSTDTSTAIPPGRHPIFSGCLTTVIPPECLSHHSTRSASHFLPDISQPPFYPADVPPSPDISHPAPDAGWERRTIQLPIELTNQDVFLS